MQIDINIDVESLKWNELRQTVKQYGLSTSGKKVDLQQRLKNYLKEAQRECEAAAPQMIDLTAAAKTGNGGSVATEAACGNVSVEAAAEDKKAAATTLTAEQRRRMEENRKRALEIRQMKQQKRLKSETTTTNSATSVITPGTDAKKNPYKNPYAKASTTTTTPTATQPPSAVAVTVSSKKAAPRPPSIPPVISAWGDCRLDLWEAVCQCGGAERHSPDVRMCRCGAALDAGLDCEGCGGGVLLIKSGPRGNFWGCSNYKKGGCKYTKKFGAPHDSKAAEVLAQIKQSAARKKERERMEWARIKDRFEAEWRSVCHCGGAKNLNTFECKMQSEGGCGMLPLCPQGCGGQLFLHASKYGSGKWWGCSNFKNGLCKFKATYEEHSG